MVMIRGGGSRQLVAVIGDSFLHHGIHGDCRSLCRRAARQRASTLQTYRDSAWIIRCHLALCDRHARADRKHIRDEYQRDLVPIQLAVAG